MLAVSAGFCPLTVHAEISAKLDRETINLGQTVRLIIESSDSSFNDQPDLSVLNETFTVLGTSTSQNISVINGKQTSVKKWISEIEPKAEGSFTIPAIHLGNQITKTLRLTVLPLANRNSGRVEDLFIEMEAETPESYVQQQTIITIRLYLSVQLLDGTLSEPKPVNTNVRRLGNDVQYETTLNGRVFRVVERKYALFPDKSGELIIPGIQFQGLAEDSESNGQFSSRLFNQGIRVRAKSNSVSLQINPPDPGFTGRSWLPASHVEILDRSQDRTEAQVGQPITRQIQIRAVGLTAEQLPEIDFPDSQDFKQYPDKTNRESIEDGKNYTGMVNRNIAVIATREGVVKLPEIKLNWWNVETSLMETAVLPEKVVNIVADPNAVSNQPVDESGTESVVEQAQSSTQASNQISNQALLNNVSTDQPGWRWISMALLIGWVLTILFFWKRLDVNKGNLDKVEKTPADQKSGKLLTEFKRACKQGDAQGAASFLRLWARSYWPDNHIQTFDKIAEKLKSDQLKAELYKLDQHLYADNSTAKNTNVEPWSGSALQKLLGQLLSKGANKSRHKRKQALPELYPAIERN